MRSAHGFAVISLLTGIVGCAAPAAEPVTLPPAEPPAGTAETAARPAAAPDPFHARLLAAAKAYETYPRVGEEPKWAPTLCAAPMRPGDEIVLPRLSASDDEASHGKKLYFLFAADKPSYKGANGAPAADSPPGQVIVKEAWVPRPAHGGFEPGDKAGLFIMIKLAADTPGTDQGWVYGTVAADGTTVTSSGRVASCMGCHQQAAHDRLFGVAK